MLEYEDCSKCDNSRLFQYQEMEDVPVYSPQLIRVARHGPVRVIPGAVNDPKVERIIEEIKERIRNNEPLDLMTRKPVTKTKTCECVTRAKIKDYLGEYNNVKYTCPDPFEKDLWKGSVLVVDEWGRFKAAVQKALLEFILDSDSTDPLNWPKHLTATPYQIMTRRANPKYHAEAYVDPFEELRRKDIILILRIITDPAGGGKYGAYIDSVVRWRMDEEVTTWVFVDDGLGFDSAGKTRFTELYGADTIELLNELKRVELKGMTRRPD